MKQRHHGFENRIEHHLQAYAHTTAIVIIIITIIITSIIVILTIGTPFPRDPKINEANRSGVAISTPADRQHKNSCNRTALNDN